MFLSQGRGVTVARCDTPSRDAEAPPCPAFAGHCHPSLLQWACLVLGLLCTQLNGSRTAVSPSGVTRALRYGSLVALRGSHSHAGASRRETRVIACGSLAPSQGSRDGGNVCSSRSISSHACSWFLPRHQSHSKSSDVALRRHGRPNVHRQRQASESAMSASIFSPARLAARSRKSCVVQHIVTNRNSA